MEKKNKIIFFLGVLVLLAGGVLYYYEYFLPSIEKEPAERVPSPGISEEEIEGILTMIRETTDQKMIDKFGDFIRKENLINLVHIRKEGDEYHFVCWKGPSYHEIHWDKFFPDAAVAMGQVIDIDNCSLEKIKIIDRAVMDPFLNCQVYLDSSINLASPPLEDYYLVSYVFNEGTVITPGLIDSLAENSCAEVLKDFIGSKKPSIGTAVVDLKESRIFY